MLLAALVLAGGCASAPEATIDASTAGSERYVEVPDATPIAIQLVEPDAIESADDATTTTLPELGIVQQLVPEVVSERDHDRDAFTQGLEFHEGRLFESTGAPNDFVNSTTTIREVDPLTGDVLRERDFGEEYFGEGLTIVGDRIIQLSWLAQRAQVFDLETFETLDVFEYEGQGWGLCYDGTELVMTDGSGFLFFRNPITFELLRKVEVLRNGIEVSRLNELECVDGSVWANIWQSTEILRIDATTGTVTGVVDATELAAPFVARYKEHVLNGIAYDPVADTFLITGKNWSSAFEVNFVQR